MKFKKSRNIQRLIKQCIQGDTKAKKELYDKFAPKMLSICYRYASSRDNAEDIFQEGFFKVYTNLNKLRNPSSIEAWMKKIFINEALQVFKRESKSVQYDILNGYENTQLHESRIIDDMQTLELTKLIQQLPVQMRLVFNLYVIEGYSHKEISEKLEISVGTSKSNLHDARIKLQTLLITKLGIKRYA